MKTIAGLLSAALLLFILPGCNKVHVAEPDTQTGHTSVDTAVADIDTTLHIQTTQEGNLTIYKIDRYKTVVVRIPRISSYLYMQRPTKSLQQIAQDSNYALVVNASYFDHDASTGLLTQAGLLKILDTTYEDIKDDRQLSRLFAYRSVSNIVNYFGVNDLDKTKDFDLVVQIGPQILLNNEIDTASIEASFNGVIPWPRTAFASVNGKEFYVIVNLGSAPVTLIDLGTMLRSTGIFKKDLNVINFDGGLSTSLYIKNHPECCTFPDSKMPLLIGVK